MANALREQKEAREDRFREEDPTKRELGERHKLPATVAEFFEEMSKLIETEKDEDVRKAYEDIALQFSAINDKVEKWFNKEQESFISQAEAAKIGGERTDDEGGEMVRDQFLSDYHQQILYQTNANFVRAFHKAIRDAEKEFGKAASKQGEQAQTNTRKKIAQFAEAKMRSWNALTAYNFSKRKAFQAAKKSAKVMENLMDSMRVKKLDEAKETNAANRAMRQANWGYFQKRNPWISLTPKEMGTFWLYVHRISNGDPIIPREGADKPSFEQTLKGIIRNQPLEPYDEWVGRTKEELRKFTQWVNRGGR